MQSVTESPGSMFVTVNKADPKSSSTRSMSPAVNALGVFPVVSAKVARELVTTSTPTSITAAPSALTLIREDKPNFAYSGGFCGSEGNIVDCNGSYTGHNWCPQ